MKSWMKHDPLHETKVFDQRNRILLFTRIEQHLWWNANKKYYSKMLSSNKVSILYGYNWKRGV
jgi:hypothetical protein